MFVKALLTDLGNVVVTFDRRKVAVNVAAALPGTDVDAIDWCVSQSATAVELLYAFECGDINTEQYRAAMCQRIGHQLSHEAFGRAHVDVFARNEPVIKLWQDLRVLHPEVPLIAVSDIDAWRLPHIEALCGLSFTSVVASYMVRARKPDPAMFHAAIYRAGFEPRQCLFVDDVAQNIIGAQACGILAHHYDLTDPHRNKTLARVISNFFGH